MAPLGTEMVPASPSESAILQLVPERLLTQLRRAIRTAAAFGSPRPFGCASRTSNWARCALSFVTPRAAAIA